MPNEWTDDEVATLERLWRAGRPDREIALTLARSARGVALKRYKLGLRYYPLPDANRRSACPTLGSHRAQLRRVMRVVGRFRT